MGELNLVLLTLLLMISACSDNAVLTKQKSEPQISKIDGKPIVNISEADYYQANSKYINKVMNRLSHNGRAVVEAMNRQFREKTSKSIQEVETDAVIVGLSELKSTRSYKSNSISSNYSLSELSSEIRVVAENGDYERFELILEPHGGASRIASSTPVALNAQSTWLALNPDRFYLQEDTEGNEIWPVTFPAVSTNDPEQEIEVTLARDGTLTWPSDILNKSNSSSEKANNQLVYMDNLAIMEPCVSGPEEPCTGGGGGSGGGSGGGTGGGSSNPPDRFENSEILSAPFLALKTIRLDGTGDGSGGAELQMHVDPSYSDYNDRFRKRWQYTFDHKRGINNRPLWFSDFRLFSILQEGYKLYTDLSGTLLSSSTSVFSGRNTRTFAADTRIYKTPDVNNAGVDYNFTNMRTWSYFFLPNFESGYGEGSRLNYFPIIPLNNQSRWRILLMEDDKKYPYASTLTGDHDGHDVWTYNMASGIYQNIYTEIDANNHLYGNSDDLMWESGVSNISEASVDARLAASGTSEITTNSPGGFKYVFKKIYRTSEFRPAN